MEGSGTRAEGRFRPFQLERLPTVATARARWREALGDVPPPAEMVSVWEAYGRVLAEPVVAAGAVPPFPRSMMDGVALRSRDTVGAAPDAPVHVRLIGKVVMGAAPEFVIGPGEAALIPTGGMLPDGADAVVMIEAFPDLVASGDATPERVAVVQPVPPGENVIPAGADVEEGTVVLAAGRRLRPQDVGVLAGLGRVYVSVYRQPEVAILSTGAEIVSPADTPAPGQIRDMNAVALAALIARYGGRPRLLGVVPDDRRRLREAIEDGLASDMLVMSGGSSVGEDDWTARLLEEMGPPGIVVHGVKLAPGKPTLCALVGHKPVLGLPGNPVSALIVFSLFGVEALRRRGGERSLPDWEPVVRARLTQDVAGAKGRELHVRVALEAADGSLLARPIRGGSSQLMTMVMADGTIVVPPDTRLSAGDWVDVRPWSV